MSVVVGLGLALVSIVGLRWTGQSFAENMAREEIAIFPAAGFVVLAGVLTLLTLHPRVRPLAVVIALIALGVPSSLVALGLGDWLQASPFLNQALAWTTPGIYVVVGLLVGTFSWRTIARRNDE